MLDPRFSGRGPLRIRRLLIPTFSIQAMRIPTRNYHPPTLGCEKGLPLLAEHDSTEHVRNPASTPRVENRLALRRTASVPVLDIQAVNVYFELVFSRYSRTKSTNNYCTIQGESARANDAPVSTVFVVFMGDVVVTEERMRSLFRP